MSQQSRDHKQGRYVEYDNKPGQVLYGIEECCAEGLAQSLLTPFVVGKDENDPYSEVAAAVADAGAAADAENWKWVFIKPGQYENEGTIEIPPYVSITGAAPMWNRVIHYPERNVVVHGGFTVTTDGPRIIYNLDVVRDIGDPDCVLLVDVPGSFPHGVCQVSCQNCNLWHDDIGGVLSVRGGGGSQLVQVELTNCHLLHYQFSAPSPNPAVWAEDSAQISFRGSYLNAPGWNGTDRALLMLSDAVVSFNRSIVVGILENAGTTTGSNLGLNQGPIVSQYGPAIILSTAVGSLDCRDTPMVDGSGPWDIDGIGVIIGAGAILKYGAGSMPLINPTVTMLDAGAYLRYVPANIANWPVPLGGVPNEVLDALDIIANRLVLLGG